MTIEEIDNLINIKKEELKKVENELSLIEEAGLNQIKDMLGYYLFPEKTLLSAWRHKTLKKVDEENKKCFNYVCDMIKTNSKGIINVEDIIQYNFGESYDFIFTYNERKYRLSIPCLNNITAKEYNIYGLRIFGINLYVVDEVSSELIGTIYKDNDFAKELLDFMSKYAMKKLESEVKE